jgi:hypothetical protein
MKGKILANLIIAFVISFAVAIAAAIAVSAVSLASAQVDPQTLDCEYPLRPLVNNHCNNADPADPTTIKDKDIQSSLPDPNRDYYDGCGNRFDYKGNLKEKGSGCRVNEQPYEFNGK